MNCPRCSASLADDARFCGVCGSALSAAGNSSSGAGSTLNDATATSLTSLPDTQPVQPQPAAAPPPGSWPQPAPMEYRPQQPVQTGINQQPQASWLPINQQAQTYPPGIAAGTMNSAATLAPRKRRRTGCWLSALLVIVLLLGILVGGWFLVARPYLHNLAQTQIDQALAEAQSQILLFQPFLPSGAQIVHVPEDSLNSYLQGHDTDQLQNLHMTITPDGVELDFTVYGFKCAVLGVLIASNGNLQISNVQTQGVIGLLLSSDDLSSTLNSHFLDIDQQMHRTVDKVTLYQHKMDIQIH